MSTSNTIYSWPTPQSAHKEYNEFDIRLNTALKKDGLLYLLNPNEVANSKYQIPIPPPPPADINTLSLALFNRYMTLKADYDKCRIEATTANKKLNQDFLKAISIIESFFEPTSNVMTDISSISTHASAELNFTAIIDMLKSIYKPDKTVDAMKLIEELRSLNDMDGNGFSIYYSNFQRIVKDLRSMNKCPNDNEIRELINVQVKNPNIQNIISRYISSTASKPIPPAVQITWSECLLDCHITIANRPHLDFISQSKSSTSNDHLAFSTKSTHSNNNKCNKCGNNNHTIKDCYAKTCSICRASLSSDIFHDSRLCSLKDTSARKVKFVNSTPNQSQSQQTNTVPSVPSVPPFGKSKNYYRKKRSFHGNEPQSKKSKP